MAPKKKATANSSRSSKQPTVVVPSTWLVLPLLLGVGVLARYGWQVVERELANSPRYQLTAGAIQVTPDPPPRWIRTDVKAEVLRDSNLTGTLSLLSNPAALQRRLIDAFELHPWIRQVQRVEIISPSRVEVVLEYREPIGVVEVTTGNVTSGNIIERFLVDRDSTRLPEEQPTELEWSYLPRIVGIAGRPLVGEPWADSRVVGAVKLAARLQPVWEELHLLEIVPAEYPEIERGYRYYLYEITTSGGTRIRWGAAPELGPHQEEAFEQKLTRLVHYVEQHGPLNSIHSPRAIDVRGRLLVEKRAVKHEELARPNDQLRR